jgi:tRNA(fMet)-specific endonuclease VapC
MTKVLLDTNAYTSLLAGDETVLEALSGAATVFMSVVVLGELLAGFRGGAREGENRRRLDQFLRRGPVRTLDVNRATAEVFGALKQQLRADGSPIPVNDVWIAAHSVEVGAWLVTHDRHFLSVQGLLLWDGLTRG